MMSCFTKWSTIYTSSSLYQHLTGTFFVYFSATKHTKFHIIVVILYSQEISYQYHYLLSGMPTPRFKICTKCDGKSVQKPVVLVLSKKFFGCWPLHNIFHLGQLFLKTQNLPSSISLLMSLSNFYVIKHLEIIHPPKTGGLQFFI